MCVLFFVFKQKTAYEMRISDWSSDVCSSDLDQRRRHLAAQVEQRDRHAKPGQQPVAGAGQGGEEDDGEGGEHGGEGSSANEVGAGVIGDPGGALLLLLLLLIVIPAFAGMTIWKVGSQLNRSEEHTSELQSLMRISYAVFCLK